MKYGIVGGGIAGLYTAYKLQQLGHEVTVFEKTLGGLASGRHLKDSEYTLERYYHHFFLSDTDLIELLKELSIPYHMRSTPMAFYAQGKLFPFRGPLDLLRFTPLRFHDRILLGVLTLYFQHSNAGRDLHHISVKDWISKYFTKGLYNNFWKPLIMAKFGREDIPASFIWGRINPRSKSRRNGKEVLCYPKGGFQVIFERLVEEFKELGGRIIPRYATSIDTEDGLARSVTAGKNYLFDRVIVTAPNNAFTKLAELPKNYVKKLEAIDYQAIVCAKVFLSKRASDYYWMNTNETAYVSGVIEHTNFIDKKYYNDEHILYVFNYVPQDHEILSMTDTEIKKLYTNELEKILPGFDRKTILRWQIDRTRAATPVYNLDYDKTKPSFDTPIPNVYLLNTSQVFPEDRNTSHGILYAKRLLRLLNGRP